MLGGEEFLSLQATPPNAKSGYLSGLGRSPGLSLPLGKGNHSGATAAVSHRLPYSPSSSPEGTCPERYAIVGSSVPDVAQSVNHCPYRFLVIIEFAETPTTRFLNSV